MNYRTLMTSKEIPWHNPVGLTPEQVDPNIDGWRLATLHEVCADSPLRGKCERFLDSRWDADRWYCNSLNQTYRTREPLPEKYRHLVEPEIPAGLPLLPEPPAGHYLVHRGFGFKKDTGVFFLSADYGDGFHGWIKSIIAGAVPDVYYVEAVKIEEPDYSDPEYRKSIEEAFRNGAAIEDRHPHYQPEWEAACRMCAFNWNGGWEHRIAPNQPAKDPAPDSDAHKLAVLMASVRGEATQFWQSGEWVRNDSALGCLHAVEQGLKVRIKPASVKVPLSDYRVSEVLKVRGEIRIIEQILGNAIFCDTGNFTAEYLAEHAQIHRNGKWRDCFRLEEGGK